MITSNHDVSNWLQKSFFSMGLCITVFCLSVYSTDISLIGRNPNYPVILFIVGCGIRALYFARVAVTASNRWNAGEFGYTISQSLTGLIMVISTLSIAKYFMFVQTLLIEYVVTVSCFALALFFMGYTLVHLYHFYRVIGVMTRTQR